MATNTKITTLDQLKLLANRVKTEDAALGARIDEVVATVEGIVATGGEANVLNGIKVNGTALAITDKMVDLLIAAGEENGTISVNGAAVAITGLQALAYKAKISEADLDEALTASIAAKATAADLSALTVRVTTAEGKIDTLVGTDVDKSVRAISAEEVAKIVAGAPESYDTLKELADWLASHETDAAAMNSQINTNKTNIASLTALVGTLPEGAASTNVVAYIAEAIAAIGIGDYAKTAEVATAISTALANYYTKEEAETKFTDEDEAAAIADQQIAAAQATDAEVAAAMDAIFTPAGD